jgi:hypothetical protein
MGPPKRHGMSDIMACWNPDQKVVPGWSASRLESEPLASSKNQAPWPFMVPDLPDARLGSMSACRPSGQNAGERRGVRYGIRRQSLRRLSSNCIVSDKLLLPQTGVLSLGVLQSRDVAVGVLPEIKEVLTTVPHKHSRA